MRAFVPPLWPLKAFVVLFYSLIKNFWHYVEEVKGQYRDGKMVGIIEYPFRDRVRHKVLSWGYSRRADGTMGGRRVGGCATRVTMDRNIMD